MNTDILRVAIVGAGLIGSSMARLFTEQGLDVTVHDPDDAARHRLEAASRTWHGPRHTLRVDAQLGAALQGAQFVFEAAPERLPVKRELLAKIEPHIGADIVIATATSALLVSDMQPAMAHPQRLVAAHPFNPPHLVPLIEVAGSVTTSQAALATTVELFIRLGRRPVRLQREAVGHIANRLSSALYREAVSIVASGIATVADVDDAVRFGPGLRWAVMGPHMLYHLGAGDGGYARYLEHLGPTQEARWADLGSPRLDAATQKQLVDGVTVEAAGRAIDSLCEERDKAILAILGALAALPPQTSS